MRKRKEVLWTVVISAALLTAGLVLSCGDDDNGAAVSCEAVCEKLDFCEDFVDDDLGDTVAECMDTCEEELAEAGEELAEALKCIPDTDCWEIKGSCLCPTVCEKLDECDMMDGPDNMAECMEYCDDNFDLEEIMCFYTFSSCLYIDMFCPEAEY